MIQSQQFGEEQTPDAGRAMVTPEELAKAIAAIESRKQAEADGLVAIGDILPEIGLNLTPSEVLAEVQAQRAQSRTKPHAFSLGQFAFIAVMLLAGFGACAVTGYHPGLPPASSVYIAPLHLLALDPNLEVGDASGKMVMLSEVGDDQPVQCIINNDDFQPYLPGSNATWTLIKHGGKAYLRGWIARMSLKVLKADGATISAQKSDPQFTEPITLPLDGFEHTSNGEKQEEFQAENIHLDKHAWEKW